MIACPSPSLFNTAYGMRLCVHEGGLFSATSQRGVPPCSTGSHTPYPSWSPRNARTTSDHQCDNTLFHKRLRSQDKVWMCGHAACECVGWCMPYCWSSRRLGLRLKLTRRHDLFWPPGPTWCARSVDTCAGGWDTHVQIFSWSQYDNWAYKSTSMRLAINTVCSLFRAAIRGFLGWIMSLNLTPLWSTQSY